MTAPPYVKIRENARGKKKKSGFTESIAIKAKYMLNKPLGYNIKQKLIARALSVTRNRSGRDVWLAEIRLKTTWRSDMKRLLKKTDAAPCCNVRHPKQEKQGRNDGKVTEWGRRARQNFHRAFPSQPQG
jgi:hypothetical protein